MKKAEKDEMTRRGLRIYKQKFLAHLLGLSYQHWNQIMIGKRPLTKEHIKQLKKFKLINK